MKTIAGAGVLGLTLALAPTASALPNDVTGRPSDWERAICTASAPSPDTGSGFVGATPNAVLHDICTGSEAISVPIELASYNSDEAMTRDINFITTPGTHLGPVWFAAVRTPVRPTNPATVYMLFASSNPSALAPLQQYGIVIRHN